MTRRAFSSSVFIVNRSLVLLVRHKLLQCWLPVGGEREGDETPQETARREAREETGYEVTFPKVRSRLSGAPDGLLGYDEHEAGPKGLHMNFSFLAIHAGPLDPRSDGSWDDYAWVQPGYTFNLDKYNTKPNVVTIMWSLASTIVELNL